jgi:hypothetical protein
VCGDDAVGDLRQMAGDGVRVGDRGAGAVLHGRGQAAGVDVVAVGRGDETADDRDPEAVAEFLDRVRRRSFADRRR